MKKRLLAILLTLAMVLSLLPHNAVHAAGGSEAPQAAAAAEATRAEKTQTVLAFSSDVHNASNNTSASRMDTWIDKVVSIHGGIDVMAFCGDMGSASAGESEFWTYSKAAMDVVTENGIDQVHTTGNHEFYNGKYSSTSNSVKNNYIIGAEGMNGDNFRIYCLGTANWNNSQDNFTTDQVTALTNYMDGIGADKPIIVLTHFPLHRYNSRSTTNADKVIDALNAAASTGKKIVVLWGHNHTMSDTNYDQIYEPGSTIVYNSSGSSKTFNFFYGAAGCMSDSEYGSGSAYVKGKGLVITINNKNQLSFTYYDANGTNVTENGTFTEQDPVAAEGISVSPTSLEVEVGRSSKLTVTFTPADTTNKAVTWTSSDTSKATVDSNGKVKGVAEGNAVITATSVDGGFTGSCNVQVIPRTSTEVHYVIRIGNYVLSTERSSDQYTQSSSGWGGGSYTYTGLAAVAYSSAAGTDEETRWIIEETDGGYYIMSMDGRYLNATYTSSGSSWNATAQGNLKLDDTPDVWVLDDGVTLDSWEVDGSYLKSTNASTGNSSAKYLAEETGNGGAHLFTVRSKDNADQTTLEEASDPVAVTGVTVSPAEATIEARKTVQLTATVTPENATNKSVIWSSSDTTVATVDTNGKVKGVGEGTAIITATTADAAKTATSTITVTQATSAGTIYVLADSIKAGGEYLIVSAKADGNAYALSNPGATSSGATPGAVQVVVSGEEIETEEEAIIWTAETRQSGFTLTNGENAILAGKSGNLGIYTLSSDPYADRYWTYDGTYLQYEGGSYTYELYYENGFTVRSFNSGSPSHPVYLFERVIDPVAVTGVTVSPAEETIEARKSVQLTATVSPENATNKKVTWKSSDTSVATVDANGKVKGVAEGTATITVTTADGGKTATATIHVTPSTSTAQHYVIVIDGYALSTDRSPNTANGGSNSYTYTGLAGVAYTSGAPADEKISWIIEETEGGYYIKDLDGNYLNATYTSGNNSGKGDLKLDATSDVWVLDSGYSLEDGSVDGSKLKSTNASGTATSDKFLSYENSANLFTVRSSGNADEITIVEAECAHNWGTPVWNWTGDVQTRAAASATATFTCTLCGETETVTASVSELQSDGYFYATVIGPDGQEYEDRKEAKQEVTGEFIFTLTADKEYVAPGDRVKFEIKLSAVHDLGSMYMELVLPEELTFVAGSGELADIEGIDPTYSWFEEDSAIGGDYIIQAFFANGDYSSETDTLIATFECTVTGTWTGTKEVDLKNLAIYSFAEVDCTDLYSSVAAEVKMEALTVTFNANEGTGTMDPQTIYRGQTVKLNANTFTRTGYEFTGWNTAADGSGTAYTDKQEVTPIANLTLYAQWTAKQYTITFLLNETDTEPYATVEKAFGEAVTTPEDPTKEGYTFAGWNPELPETMPADNLTVVAVWTPIEYTITYDLDGGAVATANPETYTIESDAITLNNPTKAGYTFAGWTGTGLDEATETVTIAAGSTGNRSYKATWTLKTYTITYHLDGGTNAAENPATYSVESEAIEFAPATKEGFTFDGWYTDQGFTNAITELPAGSDLGDLDLYAKWMANTFAVSDIEGTFTYTGLAQTPEVTVKDGETTLVLGTDYKVEYQDNVDAGTATVVVTGIGNYAAADAVTKTFVIGKAPLTVTAKAKTITYGDAPANDGVTYEGFVNNETEEVLSGTLAYAYSYEQYGDVGEYTITPSGLTSDNYEITFAAGKLTVEQKEVGLSWGTTTFTYDGEAHVPEATATGLVNNDACTVTVEGAQTAAGTYTATATGLSNANYKLPANATTEFTIEKAAQEAPEGIEATDETVSGKNDGTISGLEPGMEYSDDGGETWTTITEDMLEDGTLTGLEPGDYRIRNAGDDNHAPSEAVKVTIEAGQKLTVTFNSNGGSDVAAQSVDYNGTATKPKDPTKEGFIFGGWYSDEDLTEAYDFSTKVTANITLYAKWNEVAPEGYHIILDNRAENSATTSLIAEQLYSGEVTFTVANALEMDIYDDPVDAGCVVALANGDGTYTPLVCTTTTVDGTDVHSFTVTVTDADINLILVLKGDANLDGTINAKDTSWFKQVSLETRELTPEQMLAANIFIAENDEPDLINAKDISYIKQVNLGKRILEW